MSLIGRALHSIWTRPVSAGRIIAVPLVLNLVVEGLDIFQLRRDDGGALWMMIVYFCISMAVVPMIAVSWHRAVLLSKEAGFLPISPRETLLAYFWRWFWLGLGLILIVGVVLALIYWAYVAFAYVDYLYGFDPVLRATDMMAIAVPPVSLYLYLMFRLGVVLPYIALEQPRMGLGQAWAATRAQSQRIALAAVIAGVVQTFLLIIPYIVYEAVTDPDTGFATASYEVPLAVFLAVSYTLTLLVGAAILTDVYGRLTPQD